MEEGIVEEPAKVRGQLHAQVRRLLQQTRMRLAPRAELQASPKPPQHSQALLIPLASPTYFRVVSAQTTCNYEPQDPPSDTLPGLV